VDRHVGEMKVAIVLHKMIAIHRLLVDNEQLLDIKREITWRKSNRKSENVDRHVGEMKVSIV